MKKTIDVYMLCPVRNATEEEKIFLKTYKEELEQRGLQVHYPAEDTVQEDETGGYRICMDHCGEILQSNSVHVFWNGESRGSYVDLGTSMGEHNRRGMKISLMNRSTVERIVEEQTSKGMTKSYEMVLLKLDDMAREK